ncbi:MAG: DMT family transporter [Nitrososphaeraceae archaeon]
MSDQRNFKNSLMDSRTLGFICVLITAVLFGSIYSLAKLPLSHIDPLLLSAIVYSIAFVTLIPVARGSFRLNCLDDFKYIIIVSVLGAVAAPLLLFYGLEDVAASDGAILANAQILFTILLSSVFFGERPKGLWGYSAIAIVIAGLFLASTELKLSSSILEYEPGKMLILGAMLCWALDNNFSRRLIKKSNVEPSKIAMLKFLIGGIVLSVLLILSSPSVTALFNALLSIETSEWLVISILAIFGFAGALLFLLEGLKRIGTIKTMIALSFTPIIGIIIAMATRGESISPIEAIATAMIAIGIFIISRT